MTEYISREDALNLECTVESDPEHIGYIMEGMALYGEHIKQLPIVDVVPVVHGKWVYKPLDKFRKYQVKCSNCDMVFIGNYDAYDEPGDFKFCPNCGATMDGDRDV